MKYAPVRHFIKVRLSWVSTGVSGMSHWLSATVEYDRMKDTLDKYRFNVILF